MDATGLLAGYIHRNEEDLIYREAARVAADRSRNSRAVLLYGPGGVGKTWMVRQLAQAGGPDDRTVWTEPIDVDDWEYWLLSNLERKVADDLDPDHRYFRGYRERLSELPRFMRPRIGHETMLSHLGQIKRVFARCYQEFIEDSGKTVVITLDTVEAIRSMYLRLTLTQWMKTLCGTLFVLSGRQARSGSAEADPIKRELEDPHQLLPVQVIQLGQFTPAASREYLEKSEIGNSLSPEQQEEEKLVHLTKGHPLWLALAIDYLAEVDMPPEVDENSVAEILAHQEELHEAFKRRLVTPYRGTDFWHEAIKRLAVVRQSVSQPVWAKLMRDRELPDNASTWEAAWLRLLDIHWVRPRANFRYVTLHDALAEELAQRVIPLHDQSGAWRRTQWERATAIYAELTEAPTAALKERLSDLDQQLDLAAGNELPREAQAKLMQEVGQLDHDKRALDQLRTAHLHYQLLSGFAEGCQQFLTLLDQASTQHDVLFEELLVQEMYRFLPGVGGLEALADVVGVVADQFGVWLTTEQPTTYITIGLKIAEHLIRSGQPAMGIELLEQLPADRAEPEQLYRLSNLLGNACMRIPERVRDGERHFLDAREHAMALEPPQRWRVEAEALKELGIYYRNKGEWQAADESYRAAYRAIQPALSQRVRSQADREQMASIQTNWAYVRALRADFIEAQNLAESAVVVRRQFGRKQGVGASLSVCGEVYRFGRNFQRAWEAYAEAERIFQELKDWPWLGVIYQEQAICLFQAEEDQRPLPEPPDKAELLIKLALDLCRDLNTRFYPSALNRAGRIFGHKNVDRGLKYLDEGIEEAHKLADGWFLLGNLVEYCELSYRGWRQTGLARYHDLIDGRAAEIADAIGPYDFPDLEGRWRLLKGHLRVHEALEAGVAGSLDDALDHYLTGFGLIAQGYGGSHGAAAIATEFRRFVELFRQLPTDLQETWREELRRNWGDPETGSISLLARLEELY